MDRQWRNSTYPFARDDFNNERRAFQEQVITLQTMTLSDIDGRYELPFQWYFSGGTHTITITGLRSQVILKGIALTAPQVIPEYQRPTLDLGEVERWKLEIEAENPASKSHSSVMVNASGDPGVTPAKTE